MLTVGEPVTPPKESWQIHADAVEFAEKNGYNQCAIVVRRNATYHHSMEQFGIVVGLIRTGSYPPSNHPKPLQIQWIRSKEETRESPEDLILVNPAPAWSSICRAISATVREMKV